MPDDPRASASGDVVGGDKITAGDISNSIAAIGAGAQVIVNEALSAADEARAQQSLEREKLAQAVARLAGRLSEQIARIPSREGSPYKNLLPYEVSDAVSFFGREKDVNDLRSRVVCDDSRCRFAILHGESGIGKTSVLQAGLMPLLVAAQHLPIYLRVAATATPLSEQIKRVLLPELDLTPSYQQMSLRAFLQQVVDLLPADRRVFVILDHFGAFFDMPPELRQKFIEEVGACLNDDSLRDHWLLSLRSDRLGRLNIFQSVTQPFANMTVLPPLSRDLARPIITAPALIREIEYEPDLLESLLDDLGGDQIDPSRLQLVCDALYQASPPGTSRFALATYAGLGRADGVLNRYLDQTLERNFPAEIRQTAWRALSLIADQPANTIPENELYAGLADYDISPDEARRVLDLLAVSRLVRPVELPGYYLPGEQFEPRIRQWAAERAALAEARAEARRQVERVRTSALRGLLGGALGFTLAYLLTFASQIELKPLLGYIAAYRALPGAIAGMLLILFIDLALASYRGPRRWLRWLVGGLAGSGAYAFAVFFHTLMRSAFPDSAELLLAAAEGAVWGIVTGVGAIWVMDKKRSLAATLGLAAVVAIVSGPVLFAADLFGGAFGEPASPLLTVLAGIVMPLCVLATAIWAEVGDTE